MPLNTLPQSIKTKIFAHLSPSELCILELVSRLNLNENWKLLVEKRAFLSSHHSSLSRLYNPNPKQNVQMDAHLNYKCLFGAYFHIINSRYIFTSCSFQMKMKKSNYTELAPFYTHQISLFRGGVNCCDFRTDEIDPISFKKPKRYLSVIPTDPGYFDRFFIHDEVLWFVGDTGMLFSKSLSDSEPLTHTLTIPLQDLKGTKASDGKGYLLTRDRSRLILKVWTLSSRAATLLHEIHSPECILAYAVNDFKFAILQGNQIKIWDSGKLLDSFEISSDFKDCNRFQISFVDGLIGLAGSSELECFFYIYQEKKYKGSTISCAKVNLLGDQNTNFPANFHIQNNLILTNGSRRNELNTYNINSSEAKITVTKVSILTEKIANQAYGFSCPQDQDAFGSFIDESTIWAITGDNEASRLLIWNFGIELAHDRYYELVALAGLEFYLAYEDL